jgi:hypothetical protein
MTDRGPLGLKKQGEVSAHGPRDVSARNAEPGATPAPDGTPDAIQERDAMPEPAVTRVLRDRPDG